MSEFRKDGGGDFDKRGGATPPSSGSGASGIDPFGFKHEVQAALRAEHRPSPEVMDLIQRWRIPEHVVRAVQAHVEGNLSEHNALSSLHRDIKPVADRDATSDFHVHTAIPGGARFRFSSERSPVVAYVPFSLEDLPGRGRPLITNGPRWEFILAPIPEHRPGDYPVHARGLELDGWKVVEQASLGPDPSACLDELRLALLRLEGIVLKRGDPSGIACCPECGRSLQPLSYMHTPVGMKWTSSNGNIERGYGGCKLLENLPLPHPQQAFSPLPLNGDIEAAWLRNVWKDWSTLSTIHDDVWRSGLPTDGQHLPHGLIDNYRRISLEYRLLPKRAHEVEVPACHGCRIVVPEHVRQVDTLVLEIPHHVLLRWLM